MKRGTFRRKTYPEALEARQAVQARQRERAQADLAISAPLPRRKNGLVNASPTGSLASQGPKGRQRAMRKWKPGGKVDQWSKVRARLKVAFEREGITDCEFGFIDHECWRDNGLSFAHAHKRRDSNFDIYLCALACPSAHQNLDERMSHGLMEATVMRAIELRGGIIRP